jgi:hypothetical protein
MADKNVDAIHYLLCKLWNIQGIVIWICLFCMFLNFDLPRIMLNDSDFI